MKTETLESGTQVNIPVVELQFTVKGSTIWIHGPHGGTTLRIKCTGTINVDRCENSPISHCDIIINGDINFCISEDAIK